MFRVLVQAVALSTTWTAPAYGQPPSGPHVQYAVKIWQRGQWHPYATFSEYLDANRTAMNLETAGWDARVETIRAAR